MPVIQPTNQKRSQQPVAGSISLNFIKDGYDPFIDFLKAYCIICVVVSHCMPPIIYDITLFRLWGDMQVPLFILIQVFHAYKRSKTPQLNYGKLLRRIIIPFIVIQLLIIGGFLIWSPFSLIEIGRLFFTNGGIGPGSYYPWIYIQLAFVLVWIYPYIKKMEVKEFGILLILFSVGIEILFSVFHGSDKFYRLTCFRYLFLIFLGCLWVDKGIRIK